MDQVSFPVNNFFSADIFKAGSNSLWRRALLLDHGVSARPGMVSQVPEHAPERALVAMGDHGGVAGGGEVAITVLYIEASDKFSHAIPDAHPLKVRQDHSAMLPPGLFYLRVGKL